MIRWLGKPINSQIFFPRNPKIQHHMRIYIGMLQFCRVEQHQFRVGFRFKFPFQVVKRLIYNTSIMCIGMCWDLEGFSFNYFLELKKNGQWNRKIKNKQLRSMNCMNKVSILDGVESVRISIQGVRDCLFVFSNRQKISFTLYMNDKYKIIFVVLYYNVNLM